MMMNSSYRLLNVGMFIIFSISSFSAVAAPAPLIPFMIPYSSTVSVDNKAFEGSGFFKFAIVNKSCNTEGEEELCVSLWSNDGSSVKGSEPTEATQIVVTSGNIRVKLGDTNLANMTEITPAVFNSSESYLRLWFNDGINGFQQLANDKQLVSVPFAYRAEEANSVVAGSIRGDDIVTSEIQARVDSCVGGGSISTINQDGSVECVASLSAGDGIDIINDQIEIKAGSGLNFDNGSIAINPGEGLVNVDTNGVTTLEPDFTTVQKRVGDATGECDTGSAIRKLNEDGTVVCQEVSPISSFPGDVTKLASFAFSRPFNYQSNMQLELYFLGCEGSQYNIGVDVVSQDIGEEYSTITGGLICVNCDPYIYNDVAVAAVPDPIIVGFPFPSTTVFHRHSEAVFTIADADVKDIMLINFKRSGAATSDICTTSLNYKGANISYTNTDLNQESRFIPVSSVTF